MFNDSLENEKIRRSIYEKLNGEIEIPTDYIVWLTDKQNEFLELPDEEIYKYDSFEDWLLKESEKVEKEGTNE